MRDYEMRVPADEDAIRRLITTPSKISRFGDAVVPMVQTCRRVRGLWIEGQTSDVASGVWLSEWMIRQLPMQDKARIFTEKNDFGCRRIFAFLSCFKLQRGDIDRSSRRPTKTPNTRSCCLLLLPLD
jgi:hypothetical protein